MKNLILIFSIIFLFLSCSKDEPNESLEPQQLFIKQINENGVVSRKYTYTNELISNREYYNNGQLSTKDNIEYLSDVVIVRTYNSFDELLLTRKYYSLSNEISRRDQFNSNHELMSYRIYTFSNNTCGFLSIDSYDNNDNLNYKSTFEYVDDNCSMKSIRFDPNNQILDIKEWIRDDKNQYNKNELLDFFKADNLGNTISYNKWDSQSIIDSEYSYESTFNYNNANYPINEQRIYLNGVSKEFTYEYY